MFGSARRADANDKRMKVLNSIRAFLRDRIGWNRIGVAIGVSILLIALYVLYDYLRDIEPRHVARALRQSEISDIALAAILVAAAYFTLTFYDLFAVRTIGRRDVPYSVCAMAGFCSYSIGHNVGFSVFSGGTVRYRIYSTASNLTVIDVAKICFIAGLTFWLGNIAILGIGMAIHPEAASAVDRLPADVNRWLGIGALTGLVLYVIFVSTGKRQFGRDGWKITLPGSKLTILQIFIGIVDLLFCAAAMYVLMPDKPSIDFISLAVIFVSATLLGFASHTPGGLGVFDAAMLLALRQFNKEELLSSLLLFRLLYYITPFVLSLIIMGIREFVLDIKPLIVEKKRRKRVPSRKKASRRRPRPTSAAA
jgi:glycosyltransferase 2 family protein